jgi:UDP-2,4-diacetamido-2,4,6-trideoxy-beta-L-altropyranose hydrolase
VSLILRKAAADDSRDLWRWRNDEQTRRCSRATDVVAWSRHDAWYRETLTDGSSQILVALDAGIRIGMIRFDRIDKDRFRANIVVAPAARGRGLGHAILRLGCDRLVQEYADATIVAEVRFENIASQRIFEANGFHRNMDQQQSELHIYVKGPADSS